MLKVSPSTKTSVLIRRENRDRHLGRMPCDDGNRDWSNVSTRQGMSRTISNPQGLGREHFPQTLEEVWPCQQLYFTLLASRTEGTHFCHFKPPSLW